MLTASLRGDREGVTGLQWDEPLQAVVDGDSDTVRCRHHRGCTQTALLIEARPTLPEIARIVSEMPGAEAD